MSFKPHKNSVMKNYEDIENVLDKAQFVKNISTEIGFDTNDNVQKAFEKIKEEFEELKDELTEDLDLEKTQKEIGDLLFAICSLTNKLDVKAKDCLEMTVEKFVFRNCYVEKKLKENGQTFKNGNMEDMCRWWHEAKKIK